MFGKLWNWIDGKKTFASLAVYILKKGLDVLGIETISDEQLSAFVDKLLVVAAAVSLRMAVGKNEQKAEEN